MKIVKILKNYLFFVALLLFLGSGFVFSVTEQESQEQVVYGSYIIEFENNEKEEVIGKIKEAIDKSEVSGGVGIFNKEKVFVIEKEFQSVFNGAVFSNISDQEVLKIKEVEGVKNIWENKKVEMLLVDSVPLIQGGIEAGKLDQYGNNCIESEEPCLDGSEIKIAVIDTGVDYNHSVLGGGFGEGYKVVDGYDFVTCEEFIDTGGCVSGKIKLPDEDPIDEHGHGTHVASIAAGKGDLNGVAPEAEILAYRVLNQEGEGLFDWVISGIDQAVADGADVINLSLGGSGNPDDPVSTAVDNAVLSGVVVVVSAGNEGPSSETILSPGVAREAITVGSTNKDDTLSFFSSRGPVNWLEEVIIKPDVVAPGVSIQGAMIGGGYIAKSGTSMSAPHIAGVSALLLQRNSVWTPGDIKEILKQGSIDLGLLEDEQGSGRTDLQKILKLQQNYSFVVNIDGNGSVSKNEDKESYTYEEEVVLTATPDSGGSFSHWSGDISGSENPKTVTMNESKTVNAIFEREAVVVEEYNLSISVSGSGTVVKNPDGESYRNGTEVELTASDSSGWRFSGWSGDASGSENPINVTMNDDKDITVTFSKISSGGGGGGSRIPRDDDDDEDDDEEDDDEEEDEEGEKLELENELVSFDDDSFEEYKEQAEEKQKEVEALESSHNRLENIKKNAESIINFLEESGNNETAEAVSEIISKAEQLQEKIKEQLQEKEQELEEVEKKKEKVENFKRAERISETASLLLENIENEEIRRVLEEVIAKTEEIKQKIQSN
jgi:subtilisin family serine protease